MSWGCRRPFPVPPAWASGGLNFSDPQRPKRLNAGVVTADFFNTLGVGAVVGRAFVAGDGRPGNGRVVVLSYQLWQQQFGGRKHAAADDPAERSRVSGDWRDALRVLVSQAERPVDSNVGADHIRDL